MTWIISAVFSAIFAGLTSVLAKCGIKKTDSDLATALRTIVVLVFSWLMVFVVGSQTTIVDIQRKSLILLVLSGLSTGASWICYFKALSMGDVNKVVPIDKSSTVLTVLLAIDLTPDDLSDNAGNDPASVRFVRVHAQDAPTTDQTTLYNYRRFVFDVGSSGEDLAALIDSGLLLAVYADVYYIGDIDYDKDPYGVLCLYDYKTETEVVKLTRRDRKALERFGS